MIVWLVRRGCLYEGGGVEHVCATRELAERRALILVEEEIDSHLYVWKQSIRDDERIEWTNGVDFVQVILRHVEEDA